jgi:hypothetical protein
MAEPAVASNGQKRTPLPQPGIILYPALGNPELVSGDDDVHILACLTATPKEMEGDAGRQIVADHLKFLSLEGTEWFKLRRLTAAMMHAPFDISIVRGVESLSGFATASTPVFKNEDKRFYGIFRSSIMKYFTKGALYGYTDERIAKVKPENPYHIVLDGGLLQAWIRKNLPKGLDHHCFANWATKPGEGGFRELEEEAVTNGLRKTVIERETKFIGPRVQTANDDFVDANDDRIHADAGPLRVFDIFEWKFQLLRPLATLHPVFFYPREKNLNIGFISDLHVVSRLEVLRRSDFQLVPGADGAQSPRLGDMMSTPGRAVRDLMSKAGIKSGDGEVDVLVMGGDLIDFAMGCFPGGAPLPDRIKASKARSMVNAVDSTVPTMYDYGIDYMAIYDLVVQFYRNAEKPVVILAGNHDAYDKPFGISPRAAKNHKLGNPGIPMDANLTVMEACLLYGDHYGYYAHAENFRPAVMDCFYLLFTPVFSFTSKMGKMQWISLGWGDDEDMFWDGPGWIPGHLPNAELAISDAELPLIDYGVNHASKAGAKCVMLSHYTWACYADPVLQDGSTVRDFPTGNHDDTTDYNLGTCELNRLKVYLHMENRKIHYTVSGHAHRSGVYIMTVVGPVSERVNIKGYPIEGFKEAASKWRPPYMIVSDSAGPIPRENVRGEFNGQGSTRPSFTKLVFDAFGELTGLTRVPSTLPATLPRIAVTMDYCEIEANGLIAESGWGAKYWLKEIACKSGLDPDAALKKKEDWNPYLPVHVPATGLDKVPNWIGLQSLVLYLKDFGNAMKPYPIEYTSAYGWAIKDVDLDFVRSKRGFKTTGFLCVHLGTFSDKANGSTAPRYDFTKPWVQVVDVEFSPPAPGFFSDSDMSIGISRNWDFLKYPTQSLYNNIIPAASGSGGGSGAPKTSNVLESKPPKATAPTGNDVPGASPLQDGKFTLPWTF